jgi:hypothetical protein
VSRMATRNSRGGWDITDEEADEIIRLSEQHSNAENFLPCPGKSRMFRGYRPQPPAEYAEKGITNSGSSPDYEGVVWSDGTVSVRWLTEYRSFSNWASWEDFHQVHGHPEYGTTIVFQGDDGWQ